MVGRGVVRNPKRTARMLRLLASRSAVAGAVPARSLSGEQPMPQAVSSQSIERDLPAAEVVVHGPLTAAMASSLCRTVRAHLETGIRQLFLNLEDVKATDVVGLASLLQSARRAALVGVHLSVLPSPVISRALLQGQLLDELPLASGAGSEAALSTTALDADRLDATTPFLARTVRVGLRQPAWEELALFEQWADNPLLDQMVGSELLYRCRHLGPYHPDFVSLVLNDPTSLTLLVQPVAPHTPPVGFVRLYNIRLAEQFAFLETAVADLRAHRKGWGIEGSRLLLGYAMDALGIRRVEAKVYAYNVLSINSLKRNGFQQEGVLRQAKAYDGQSWDIFIFSILEEEMLEQRKQEEFPYMGFWS